MTYALIGVLGLGVNNAAIYGAIEWLGMPLLISKAGAAVMTFMLNFSARKFLLFQR